MKTMIVKRVDFCAAHFLPNYDGICKNLHGHTWSIDIGVSGPVNENSGMVVDFADLKKALQPILNSFDHKLLNNVVKNPTAENIALHIKDTLLTTPTLFTKAGVSFGLEFVRVWESPDSYAEVGCE